MVRQAAASLTPRASLLTAGAALTADFLRFAGPRSWKAAALMLAGALAEGLSLALIVPLVALIADPASERAQTLFGPLCGATGLCAPQQHLALILTAFVAAMALRSLLLAWRDRVMVGLETGFVEHHRMALVRALAASRWQDLAELRHARFTYLLAAEIGRLSSAVRQVANGAASLAMLTGQVVLLALLAPALALLFIAAALIAVAAALPMVHRAGRAGESSRRGNQAILNIAGQLLGGLKLALAQNLQQAFVAEIGAASAQVARDSAAYEARAARSRIIGSTAAAAALALMVLAGVYSQVPAASLVVSLAIFVRMLGPGAALLRSLPLLARSLPAHGEIVRLRSELGGGEPLAAQAGKALTGCLEFHDVSFAQGDGAVQFRGLNLTIPPGSRIGIAGPSGAGKTTFVDLICGLHEPQGGRITAGGEALTGTALQRWRAGIAYVAQDSYLFNDSLRRNLTWGLEAASDDEIAAALELAEATAIVRGLPLGLDQPVGERGVRLSGGERQRLALARAILRRPTLLILDEATNAIDLAAEARILNRIAALPQQPTLLIVAHRPEALSTCDRILTFADGRLVSDSAAN